MYLFEKIEDINNEFDRILYQIDFIFNNFCKDNKVFNGFGVNIWDLNLENLRNIIEKEEPRVLVKNIQILNDKLLLNIEYNGEIYEYNKYI